MGSLPFFHQTFLEHFEIGSNSFEQLCINFLNEKIREFTTNRLITEELDWYNLNGLEAPEINYLNNQNIIGRAETFSLFDSFQYTNFILVRTKKNHFLEILEHKTEGILSMLDDENKQRNPSNINLMNRIVDKCSRKPAFGLPTLERNDALRLKESSNSLFIIRHFAKHVCYSAVLLNLTIYKKNELKIIPFLKLGPVC